MTPFSNALVHYRKRAGLSQTNVARQLGVTIQYVWKLERAVKPPPSTEQIERIAAVLGMSNADVASLLEAALDSQKKLRLPDDLHSDTLRLINRLVRASMRLSGDEVTLLDELVTRLDR
ncbi:MULTISPECIES: helix-turn-helix domain-containing protein [Burkholderia cepacia complex]|uniref:XRE family transcriptional regulator n=1 Tax=Burkholderia cenocepacia TaxID=95486 RepID=A0A6J5JQ60_9BURK|nr:MULTISPECIES: helix-turn-helix transcriptional regulator [Burkholderia cepacia complex]PAJ86398.1 transcriptional regulator [Burkholderia ubonensis]PAK06403.1 transcriptional regulator [Burkholderia ubonensis]RQP75556.1 helix-turn-helix domain-containing protein [Burkholderia ubonensis]RQQ06221.1 helix-turn-helix domain-containing protein [Burkholderia ubonensis]CAB3973317.1 XRE family transcriptional regulator [Burkholderia cenocepacia]